jgi:hypothetical protein
MIVFYVSLTLVLAFEYWINPYSIIWPAKAEYYLVFSFFVSSVVLLFTIYSFMRLVNLIRKYREEVFDSLSKDLYNSFLGLLIINMSNIASYSIYLANTKSSGLIELVLFP